MTQSLPDVASESFLGGSLGRVMGDPLAFLTEQRSQLGDSFRFRVGTQKIYFFAHPDQVKSILTERIDDYRKEKGLGVVLGESVLTTDGPLWHGQRKSAQPYFQRKRLESLIPTVDAVIQGQLRLALGGEVDFADFCTKMIYVLVVNLLFKEDPSQDFPDLTQSINRLTDHVLSRMKSPIHLPTWVPTRSNRALLAVRRKLFDFIGSFMEPQSSSQASGDPSFLRLLEEAPGSSASKTRTQALTFFLAGFETTANVLFWTFYCLFERPRYFQNLRAEVDALELEKLSTLEAVNGLHWTKAVIQESMRLYPPSWFRSRILKSALEIGGYPIPKNSLIWISQYVTHRHPDFWPQPDQFQPERFFPGATAPRSFSYFPFSGGKNVCIGRDMAMMELILIVAHLAKSFELERVGSGEIAPLASITLRPSRPMNVKFSRRVSGQPFGSPSSGA